MKKRAIKMHNELAMAKYRMTLSEQKLFVYAIKNINQDESYFSESVFTVAEFAENANLDVKHVYKEIENMITGIMKTIISIKNKNNTDKWRKYNLTQNCYYDNGKIVFKFNEDMRVFLLQLQQHYYLQAPIVITFDSWYSMRLYDMFKAYAYKDQKFTIPLDELKEMLGLEGKYKRFNNFREKVVDVALKEINEKSDIYVLPPEKETIGMKVIGLVFTIEKDTEGYLKEVEHLNNIKEIKLKANLMDSNFNNKQVMSLYECVVNKFIEYRDADDLYLYMSINYQYTKKQNPGNMYGYYKTCLENDHAKAISQILTGYTIESFI